MNRKLFSERLYDEMIENNMKQADLCRVTGIGKSAMSQYLSSSFIPKNDKIYLLAKALNVTPEWLLGYDVDKKIINNFHSSDLSEQCKELNTLCQQMNELGMDVTIAYAKYVLTNEDYKKEIKDNEGKKIVA
jgi:transcriptional regulator with XRE-family HTH domain